MHIYHVYLTPVSALAVKETFTDRCTELSPKKTSSEEDQITTSVSVDPSESTASPKNKTKSDPAIRQGWTPNHQHKVKARDLRQDLDEMVDEFLATQAATENRSDWDKTFSRFMSDFADGNYWATA